jgi:hypothetical protein
VSGSADDVYVWQTSLDRTGSDAMHPACDYSAAYCILNTDSEFQGHGMVCLHNPSVFAQRLLIFFFLKLDFHNRPRERNCLQSRRSHRRQSQRQDPQFLNNRLGPDVALPRLRLSIKMDWAGEGCHPSRTRRGRQCNMGFVGKDIGKACVENRCGDEP